jgi:hypothetical protein
MFHLILEEVPLEVDVLDLLAIMCVMRVCNRALVVFRDGSCTVDGLVEDLPHELAEV